MAFQFIRYDRNFLQDIRKFPGKIFCQKFPGSGAAGAAEHFPAMNQIPFIKWLKYKQKWLRTL